MTKRRRSTTRVDPAVSAALDTMEQSKKKRSRTKAQQKEAERQSKRTRKTLELDPLIVEIIEAVAEREGISTASVVNRFVEIAFGEQVEAGDVFAGHLEHSRSPRYEWIVSLQHRRLKSLLRAYLDESA